jgi:hypothetical protein
LSFSSPSSSSSFPLYSTISSSLPLDNTIMSKIQVIFQRVKEEIKKNKRLQATFALMMLYGIKKHLLLTGKQRGRTPRRWFGMSVAGAEKSSDD